jgi:uncharacterized SAM-binding protein YcdF (DUF218 family)
MIIRLGQKKERLHRGADVDTPGGIGSYGRQMSDWRIIRFLGIVTVVGFLLVSFTPLPDVLNRWAGVSARLEPAAAIVVLGAGMDDDGVLSAGSLQRAIHGITLFQRGFAPLLAFSGPAFRPLGRKEAEVRAEMARLFGVSPEAILTETTAHTTRAEAVRMAALLQPREVSTILLVTSYAHMARSRQLFENVGFAVQPAPVDELSYKDKPEERWRLMRPLVQEFLARTYYRVAGYI